MSKIWTVTIEHVATKTRYKIPVLGQSQSDAELKARDYPYSNDSFTVVKFGTCQKDRQVLKTESE